MNQDKAAAQTSAEDEERAKVHKAQEVLERTSASVGQVCLIILTLLAVIYTLYFAAGIILPVRAGAGPCDGAGTGDAFDEPPITHPQDDRGAIADNCAVQHRGGAGLRAIGSCFYLDRQSSTIAAHIDGQAELPPQADPADGSRPAAAARCDVAERAGARGAAERDRDATIQYR